MQTKHIWHDVNVFSFGPFDSAVERKNRQRIYELLQRDWHYLDVIFFYHNLFHFFVHGAYLHGICCHINATQREYKLRHMNWNNDKNKNENGKNRIANWNMKRTKFGCDVCVSVSFIDGISVVCRNTHERARTQTHTNSKRKSSYFLYECFTFQANQKR